jgi:hypothetical protein
MDVCLQVVQPVPRLAYVNPVTNQIISLPSAHLLPTGYMLGMQTHHLGKHIYIFTQFL